jgi:signal transduction histidine kinase
MVTLTSDGRTTSRLWLRAGEIVLAAICYYALARGSLLFASINASATPIWPPSGLAIALLLVRGNVMLPAVFAGALAANLAATPQLITAGAIACGNSAEALVAALLLRRWADGERVFNSTFGVLRFAVIVIAVAAPLSATIGVAALVATGFAQWAEFLAIWGTWWLGDLAGAILIAPALVLWARTIGGRETRAISWNAIATYAGAALVGLLAFSPLSPFQSGLRNAMSFLAILPLLWSALRLGLRDTATTALIISSLAAWGVIAGSSPFLQGTLNDSLVLLVAFIVACSLPSLALAAERREAQVALDQTRQELAQSQKLEALGQLTGGVAHDFNNVLMAISAGLRALERLEEERARTVQTLTQSLDRGAGLAKQLLSFARREPTKFETVDLKQALAGIEAVLAQALPPSIMLDVRVGSGLWPVRIDRVQLDAAMLNLAGNARDAMPNGGTLLVRAENVMSEGQRAVSIAVTDSGVGMSADAQARAFEPFFTTKKAGEGTGLGLAQVYSFAKQAGGGASIESAPGEGTTVTITLPRA